MTDWPRGTRWELLRCHPTGAIPVYCKEWRAYAFAAKNAMLASEATARQFKAGNEMSRKDWRARVPTASRCEFFLKLNQPVLTEEHFVADIESRNAERAARDGGVGVCCQLGLHLRVLGSFE